MTERDDALEELKIYGREPKNAEPIFTSKVHRPPSACIDVETN